MLYIFGGNIATVNEPFAKLQEPGWALMDLRSKSVVYSELELDGTHLDGVFLIQGLLEVNSTTPYDKFYYDYKVFLMKAAEHYIKNIGCNLNGIISCKR